MADAVARAMNAYKASLAIAGDMKARSEEEEMKNVLSEAANAGKSYDEQVRSLTAAATKLGQSGNVNGFKAVMGMAESIEGRRKAFSSQLAPAAMWALGAENDDEFNSRTAFIVKTGKDMGVSLPDNPSRADILRFLTGKDTIDIIETGYKAKKYEAETKHIGAQTKKEEALADKYAADAAYTRKGKPGGAASSRGKLTDKQIIDYLEKAKRWNSMDEDEKELSRELDDGKELEAIADLVQTDPQIQDYVSKNRVPGVTSRKGKIKVLSVTKGK